MHKITNVLVSALFAAGLSTAAFAGSDTAHESGIQGSSSGSMKTGDNPVRSYQQGSHDQLGTSPSAGTDDSGYAESAAGMSSPNEGEAYSGFGGSVTGIGSGAESSGTGHNETKGMSGSGSESGGHAGMGGDASTGASMGSTSGSGSMGGMMGQHKMMGTVQSIDHQTGKVTLQADSEKMGGKTKPESETLSLHFPPDSLKDVKQGDRITVNLGFSKGGQ